VALFGEEDLEITGVGDIAVVSAVDMAFAFHLMRLGVYFVDKTKGGPSDLAAKDLSGLFLDAQGLDQGAGSSHIFEQGYMLTLALKGSPSGVVTPVFQSF